MTAYRNQIVLQRWARIVDLFVEDVRFLGGALEIVRDGRARRTGDMTATVVRRSNEGYLVSVTEPGARWTLVKAVCLGTEADAWQVAGQIAAMLRGIVRAANHRVYRAYQESRRHG